MQTEKDTQETKLATAARSASAHPDLKAEASLVGAKKSDERENFSHRLQQALKNAQYSPDSPTKLAREFNVRFTGRPVTVHAARKWLVGESIPTQEKLRTIAQWLGVAAEWLRFGGAESAAASVGVPAHFDSSDVKLIADLQRLDEHHRQIAREFIRMLVRVGNS